MGDTESSPALLIQHDQLCKLLTAPPSQMQCRLCNQPPGTHRRALQSADTRRCSFVRSSSSSQRQKQLHQGTQLCEKLASSSQEPVACPASVDAEVATNRIFEGAMLDSAGTSADVAAVQRQGSGRKDWHK